MIPLDHYLYATVYCNFPLSLEMKYFELVKNDQELMLLMPLPFCSKAWMAVHTDVQLDTAGVSAWAFPSSNFCFYSKLVEYESSLLLVR